MEEKSRLRVNSDWLDERCTVPWKRSISRESRPLWRLAASANCVADQFICVNALADAIKTNEAHHLCSVWERVGAADDCTPVFGHPAVDASLRPLQRKCSGQARRLMLERDGRAPNFNSNPYSYSERPLLSVNRVCSRAWLERPEGRGKTNIAKYESVTSVNASALYQLR